MFGLLTQECARLNLLCSLFGRSAGRQRSIRYCTQELVVFREDLLTKLLRVSLPDNSLSLDPSNTYKHVRGFVCAHHLCKRQSALCLIGPLGCACV